MPVESKPSLQDIGTLRDFIRSISQGVYVVTPSGEILDANPALVEIFGAASLEELQRHRSAELVPSKEQRAERLRLLQTQGWLRDFVTPSSHRGTRTVRSSSCTVSSQT